MLLAGPRRGASGKDGLPPVPAAVMLQRGSQNDRFKTDTVQPKSLEWKTTTVWQARRFTYIRCFMVRSSQHHFRTSRSIAVSGSFFILRTSTLRSGAMMIFPRDCFMRAIRWPLEAASSLKDGLLRFLPRRGSLNMRLNTLEQFRCGHVESSGYSLDCVQGNVSPAMLNLNDERLAQPNHEGKFVRRKARLLTQGLHSSAEFFLHWFAHGHKNMLSCSRIGYYRKSIRAKNVETVPKESCLPSVAFGRTAGWPA